MRPPDFVLDGLHRIDRFCRLGWNGEAKMFCLLALCKARAVDDIFNSVWDKQGPVYGKPYDALFYVPVMVMPVSVEDVFSGKVIALAKQQVGERVADQVKRANAEEAARVRALWEENTYNVSKMLWWHHTQDGGTSNNIAKKFLKKEEDAMHAELEKPLDFSPF